MEATIVIPVYNRERLLPRTLASVAAQTYRPLHVILVDNGSTDRSSALLDDFARRQSAPDFRVTVCGESRRGAPAARNAGLARATGEWVMFFDSDDEMTPRLVECYMATAAANPDADVIYTDIQMTDDAGNTCIKRSPRKFTSRFLCGHIFHTYLSTQRYMVRRRVVDAVGGWNEALPCWNDWELGLRLLLYTSRLVKVPADEPLVMVHTHADSITGSGFFGKTDALASAFAAAGKAVRAAHRSDELRLLHCLAYKKVVLAAACTREGSPRGEELFREIMACTGGRGVRFLFRLGYALARRGVRGTSRLVAFLLPTA